MFSRSEVFKEAWKAYRMARLGIYLPADASGTRAFFSTLFAKCLRTAWAEARKSAGPATMLPLTLAAKPLVGVTGARASEISAELNRMQYSDYIDWTAHRTLSAELAGFSA